MSDLDDLLNEVNSAFSTSSAPDKAHFTSSKAKHHGKSTNHHSMSSRSRGTLRRHAHEHAGGDARTVTDRGAQGTSGTAKAMNTSSADDLFGARRSSGLDPELAAGLNAHREDGDDDVERQSGDDTPGRSRFDSSRQGSTHSFSGGGAGYGGKVSNDSSRRRFTSSQSECGGDANQLHDELDELLNLTECSPNYERSSTTGFSQGALVGSTFTDNTNSDSDKDSRSVRSMTSTLHCSSVYISGTRMRRGCLRPVNQQTACNFLQCTNCDFNVEQFPNKGWSATVDYMFLRNHFPNRQALSQELKPLQGAVAYACQCCWVTVPSQGCYPLPESFSRNGSAMEDEDYRPDEELVGDPFFKGEICIRKGRQQTIVAKELNLTWFCAGH